MTDVRVRALAKSFAGIRVLDDLTLDVPAGSLTVILGLSGCGKTTLLRLIAGFDRPDHGTIHMGDVPVFVDGSALPPERRHIGYVAQEGALFPHLDVAANIAFGLPQKRRRNEARVRVAALLDLVGLGPAFSHRYPHELSGGQQQRVALARALAPEPRVVLLDEPFSSLDADSRESTRRAVARVLATTGTTAILVTHDQAEALSLGTQIAVMRDGQIAQVDTPAVVYRTPVDLGVATFLGDAVILPATVDEGIATCVLGRLPVHTPVPNGPVNLLIRPEQLVLCPPATADTGTASVIDVAYYGRDAVVHLRLIESGIVITARVPGYAVPPINAAVNLEVHGEGIAYPPS